ncbi:MAG: hypothetical protein WDZ31_04910 [Phycisphaeraceae bacterium]
MMEATMIGLVVGVMVAVPAAALAWRRRRTLRPARSMPGPGWSTRLVETGTLGALGVAALLPLVWERTFIELPDLARPEVRQAYMIALALTGLGLLIAMLTAMYSNWCGGLLLVVLVCFASHWGFAGHSPTWMQLVSEPQRKQAGWLVFGPKPGYRGVQLHVNGVHLGELPVTISMEAFEARVPYWHQPPEGLSERDLLFEDGQEHLDRPWGLLKLPVRDLRYTWPPSHGHDERHYYAQVELDGEWGTFYGGGGMGGSQSHIAYAQRGLRPRFPGYDERVREHLQAAQETNGQVDAAWFATMASFAPRGEAMLLSRAKEDPALQRVVDTWVNHRYALNEVRDADDAWRLLERIADEAEKRGAYDMASITGAAVERLVPYLDPERLTDTAVAAIRAGYGGYNSGRLDADRLVSLSTHTSVESRIMARRPQPIRHHVFAHAVWTMHEHLQAQGGSGPNVVQRRVLDALVYSYPHNHRSNRALNRALAMGWPDGYRFMSRQPWHRSAYSPSDEFGMRVGNGGYVNVWLYRLLCLEMPDGQRFRTRYSQYLRQTADTIVEASSGYIDIDELKFLFLDPQLGNMSPGMTYWPRFKELTATPQNGSGYWGLLARVQYLIRLEPHATVPMYVEALRASEGSLGGDYAANHLEQLPPDKERAVLEAWVSELKQILENPPEPMEPWMQPERINEEHVGLHRLHRRLNKLERDE